MEDREKTKERKQGNISAAFKVTRSITVELLDASKKLEEHLDSVLKTENSIVEKERSEQPIMATLATEIVEINIELSNVLYILSNTIDRLDL